MCYVLTGGDTAGHHLHGFLIVDGDSKGGHKQHKKPEGEEREGKAN